MYFYYTYLQYMGSDMEFIAQPATALEEGRVYELLALVQSGIVTFPEHILPLVLFSPPSYLSNEICGFPTESHCTDSSQA